MKYMKRTNLYKASNVAFNPETLSAYSYSWWKFVSVIDGYVVFNNYVYSNTTARHQAKVRKLLNNLSIKIDFELPIPEGLQSPVCSSIEAVIKHAEEHLCDQFLKERIKSQESYQRKKQREQNQIKLDLINSLPNTTVLTLV